MRVLYLLCGLCLATGAWAQKISYAVPKALRQQISAADYRLLVDSAVAVAGRHYPVARVADGILTLQVETVGAQQLSLQDVVARCLAQPDRQQWGPLIRTYFTQVVSSVEAGRQLDPRRYESVRAALSLRIYPAALVAQRGGTEQLVTRTDLPGTVTMLMLDLPGAFSPVPRAAFTQWQQSEAAVFAQALANVAKQPVEKVSKDLDGPNGTKLTFNFLGNEDYAASYALDLATNAPAFVGDWGCALAIPNKGLVSTCAISRARPLDFIHYIQLSQAVIAKSYQEHQQPISPDFFWYYQGKFTRITVLTDKDGHVSVVAPLGLAALMTTK